MTVSRAGAPVRSTSWRHRPLWQVGLVSALAAAAAGIGLYAIARLAGVPMELTEVFEHEFKRMPVLNMAWAALLDGGVVATATAAACRRWAKRPRTSFVALATIGLVASLVLPATSDASTSTKVVLSISHIVVALIIAPALALCLPRTASRYDASPPEER